MKKKIITILVAVVLILPFKVFAASNDSYVDWNLDRSVFAHQYRNGSDHITNLAMMSVDGKIAYCIEPGIMADKASYYSSSTNINDTNLRGVDTNKLSLIGYYGYGYNNHNTKEYYMATQELIWRMMGVDNVWWTDQKEGGNTYNLDSYKNEIMTLVNNYEKSPSFNFKSNYLVGDEITIEDNNNILNGYESLSSNVIINNNKITIKNISEGDNKFILRRKENGKSTMYYYKDGYQTVGTFEFPYSYSNTYNVTGIYGKIIIDKYDDDTKTKETSSLESTLEGAEYGLYDENNNLIKSNLTDNNGQVIFDNLKKGNYIIKEIKASKGYTVSNVTTRTFLEKTIKTQNIKSYEKIIKNKIVILKVLDNEELNKCIPEEGIIFGIYDMNGNLVKKVETDEEGKIEVELNYGKYILKQETTFEGISKVDDKIIEVKENGITQNIVLINHQIKKQRFTVHESNKSKIESLPNTGKNSVLYIMPLLLGILGYIREKKYI